MKITKKPIDLRRFKELWDTCGDLPLEAHLLNVGEYLVNERYKNGKFLRSQKVIILVSKVADNNGNPIRYGSRKIVTIGAILDEWEYKFDSILSKESITEERDRENIRLAALERRAEGRAAWGMYSASVRFDNAAKEQEAFNASIKDLPAKEQEAKKEERRKNSSSNYMVIG